MLIHDKTGAQNLHMARDDENNYIQVGRHKGFISQNLLTADILGELCDSVFSCCEIHTHKGLCSPVSPGSRGQALFVHDFPDNIRQANRGQLFNLNAEDLRHVADLVTFCTNLMDSANVPHILEHTALCGS
ncbi:hypothetical protein RRG08_020647 [Elysia crispata]|uniref:Uncharacterized protein n=1 Tax=Elysia crispata TaxID=231223 RepID=A0AAE1D101_9GAST|nr:hypothetical protein RRG08_020647 [Elysia crispata]